MKADAESTERIVTRLCRRWRRKAKLWRIGGTRLSLSNPGFHRECERLSKTLCNCAAELAEAFREEKKS